MHEEPLSGIYQLENYISQMRQDEQGQLNLQANS